MTPTASFKEKFSHAYSIFKWELKSCSGTLSIFSILAGVFTTIILTLCIVISLYAQNEMKLSSQISDPSPFDYGVMMFQYISSSMVYTLTAIFTIVYTVRVYSYLHDKRKADLYGALPVSRITLFLSKSATAFIFSLIPALFFLGIIAIISLCLGQPLLNETIDLYINLVLGSLACISAYGLIAICCGTTINSIIMFIAVCIAYPLSAIFIKGVAGGFFYGSYLDELNNSFIMNALNPLSAYNGTNVIYWIIFTIVCLVASAFLIKKRKAERAQSSFAYYLPCHLIKILVSFLFGMFLGVLFGSLNVLGYGYAGFVFGFILGSIPAFIISHLIFYKDFSNLLKTSISLGSLIVVTLIAMGICNFDILGYNTYIPHSDDVESAGLIDFEYCYTDSDTNIKKLVKDASADFDDKDEVNSIITFHNAYLKNVEFTSDVKFQNVWSEILSTCFPFDSQEYAISYKLNNGRTVTRVYSPSTFNGYEYTEIPNDTTLTKEYVEKYSAIENADVKYITDLSINNSDYEYISIFENDNVTTAKAERDRAKIIEAFRKDFAADTDISDVIKPMNSRVYSDYYNLTDYISMYPDTVFLISITSNNSDIDYNSPLAIFESGIAGISSDQYEEYLIPKSYTNTIDALQEIGVLNSDLTINYDSPYAMELYY